MSSEIEWPGNLIRMDDETIKIHDDLCDHLEKKGYSETSIVDASVGIWGALKIMQDREDALKAKTDKLVAAVERIHKLALESEPARPLFEHIAREALEEYRKGSDE